MRRRLDLAASMIGRPAVLYLDEPTTGLDPRTRNEVWDEVKRLVATG
ncbi:ATP-binding cassette domain-containing protein OS=Streptomyces tendae OX=1932 GN=F3L20_24860 PE=4 SV=1 [Streptomyces tendae]